MIMKDGEEKIVRVAVFQGKSGAVKLKGEPREVTELYGEPRNTLATFFLYAASKSPAFSLLNLFFRLSYFTVGRNSGIINEL